MESKCSVNVNMMDRNFDNFLYRRLSTELVNASGAGDLTEVTRLIEEYRVKAGYVDLLLNTNNDVLGALRSCSSRSWQAPCLAVSPRFRRKTNSMQRVYPLHSCTQWRKFGYVTSVYAENA